jgi:hypothetical protein
LVNLKSFNPFQLTDGGDSGYDLSELELVEDGRLSGRVQPNHKDSHFLLSKQTLEQVRENVAHGGAGGGDSNGKGAERNNGY